MIAAPTTPSPLTPAPLRPEERGAGAPAPAWTVRVHAGAGLTNRLPALRAFAFRGDRAPHTHDPAWLRVLERGLHHDVYALEAAEGDRTRGVLPLAFVRSLLFGRFLVSLPYLNSNGVLADGDQARRRLIDRALALADELKVRHLELRHEEAVEHPALAGRMDAKVHMRLSLPDFPGPLWGRLSGKVRNQVRKGEKSGLSVAWGGAELLADFHAVFSRNMRDLGTPVYGLGLFQSILTQFPGDAELCVVRADQTPVAAALLLHGKGVTEVPSASSLRQLNHTCANMLLYWNLLERAVLRGQAVFDFGRSTIDGPTYRFKKQWGARPTPAVWQYYARGGVAADVRPENPRYQRLIRIWQRLPLSLTRWIGPAIVRGIP
jgi:FemAB-related protein (PEP-CTERM system-associated)